MNQKIANLLKAAGKEAENNQNYALASAIHSLLAAGDSQKRVLLMAQLMLDVNKEHFGDI